MKIETKKNEIKICKYKKNSHLISDSEDENQDDRSLLCVRDREKM